MRCSGDVDDGLAGMSDMELAKLMQADDLGKDAGTLIDELRYRLNGDCKTAGKSP
jgi:hypothetical protein